MLHTSAVCVCVRALLHCVCVRVCVQIIMHLLSTYLDSHLPPDPWFPNGKTFSTQYFLKSVPKNGKLTLPSDFSSVDLCNFVTPF